jgi:hypothetical protein
MSKPGDLGLLRRAIFAELEEQPLALGPEHGPWLNWLGVDLQGGFAPSPEAGPELDFGAAELQQLGILPEVVYSCLVQSQWHPQQDDYVARTRSEIRACYNPDERQQPGWDLRLETFQEINAYRLQELTPNELLEGSRPFWPCQPPAADLPAMEGWVLLHLESFRRLQDVVDCLTPFFGEDTLATQADLEAPELPPELAARLRIPPGLDWPTARALLGTDRVRRLLG